MEIEIGNLGQQKYVTIANSSAVTQPTRAIQEQADKHQPNNHEQTILGFPIGFTITLQHLYYKDTSSICLADTAQSNPYLRT